MAKAETEMQLARGMEGTPSHSTEGIPKALDDGQRKCRSISEEAANM